MLMKKIVFGFVVMLFAFQAYAGNAVVRIINASSYDVYFIYTSSADSDEYGRRDLLGKSVLPSGYNRLIDFNVSDAGDNCLQDIIAKTRTGRFWRIRMNVCKASEWTLND